MPNLFEKLGRYRVEIEKKVRVARSEDAPIGWKTVVETTDLPLLCGEDLFGCEVYGLKIKRGIASLKRDRERRGPNDENCFTLSVRDAKKLISISVERKTRIMSAMRVKDAFYDIVAEIPQEIVKQRNAARFVYFRGFNEGGEGCNPYDDWLDPGALALLQRSRPDLADRLTEWKQANQPC